jgi:hypothetical protein
VGHTCASCPLTQDLTSLPETQSGGGLVWSIVIPKSGEIALHQGTGTSRLKYLSFVERGTMIIPLLDLALWARPSTESPFMPRFTMYCTSSSTEVDVDVQTRQKKLNSNQSCEDVNFSRFFGTGGIWCAPPENFEQN